MKFLRLVNAGIIKILSIYTIIYQLLGDNIFLYYELMIQYPKKLFKKN